MDHTADTGKEGRSNDDRARELELATDSGAEAEHPAPDRGAAGGMMPRRLAAPLRRRPVRRLLGAGLVSRTGDWLTVGALMGWVYQETRSTASVAALMLVRLVPPILGGGAAAALVDGVRRKRLLVAVELLRAVALAVALGGVLSGVTLLVYAAIAAGGLLGAVSPVAVSALIPRLVPERELPAVNGLNGVIESSAMAVGAIAGGVLLAVVGIVPALVADLTTFLLAAVLYAAVGSTSATAAAAPSADAPAAGAPGGRLRDLLADRTITMAVGALCLTVVATGLVNATLPRLLDDLGLGAGAYGYGFGAIAIGLAVGGAIAGGLHVDRAGTAVLGRTLLASALLFTALAAVSTAPLALALLVLIGIADAIGWVVFETSLQRAAHPDVLGRAFGLTDTAVRTAMTGSIALAPLVNGVASPQGVLLTGAAVLLLGGTVALRGVRLRRSAVAVPA